MKNNSPIDYGVVITKPDKSPVETVKSNDQLKGMRRT